jgi:hypothetical protein
MIYFSACLLLTNHINNINLQNLHGTMLMMKFKEKCAELRYSLGKNQEIYFQCLVLVSMTCLFYVLLSLAATDNPSVNREYNS